MGRPVKIAFICHSGINRSRTFADHLGKEFGPESNFYFHYGGTNAYYSESQLREDHFEYFDTIYVMDIEQQMWITQNISSKYWHKVFLIGVSDEYDYMEDKLIKVVEYWMENWITHIDYFTQLYHKSN